MNKTLIILASIMAVILVGSFLLPKSSTAPTVIENPVSIPINQTPTKNPPVTIDPPVKNESSICTMDAKQCPDGSYVSRSGPKCEFAMCPSTQAGTESASLNQKILINGVHISPLEIIEDSRCPIDVTCIWAGTVKLKVKLEVGIKNETVTLTLGNSHIFMSKKITLTEVNPTPSSTSKYPPSAFKFTFKVE